MVKNRTLNRGFTLVELIISIAILALIIVAISGVMFSNNNVFRKNKSDLDVQNTALDTLNIIENDIMQAKHICIVTDTGAMYISNSDRNLIEADALNVPYTDSTGTSQVFQYNSGVGYVPIGNRIDTISASGADAESAVYDSLNATDKAKLDSFFQKVKMMSDDEIATYKHFFFSLDVGPVGTYSTFDDITGPTDLNVAKIFLVYPVVEGGTEKDCLVEYDFSDAGQIKLAKGVISKTAVNPLTDNLSSVASSDVYTEYVDSSGYVVVNVNPDSNTLTFNIDFDRNNRVYHGSRVVTIRNAHVLNDAD